MQIYSSTPKYNKFNARIRKLAKHVHLISFEQTTFFTFLNCSSPSMPPQLGSEYLEEPQKSLNVRFRDSGLLREDIVNVS
jgi:hypothetical protein